MARYPNAPRPAGPWPQGPWIAAERRSRRLRRLVLFQFAALALVLGAAAAVVRSGGSAEGAGDRVAPRRPAAGAEAATAPARPPTLVVTVTGATCRIFVRVPGGDVLFNDVLPSGRSASFDEPRLDVVLSDGGAVDVRVNGVLRPEGTLGERLVFTATRS